MRSTAATVAAAALLACGGTSPRHAGSGDEVRRPGAEPGMTSSTPSSSGSFGASGPGGGHVEPPAPSVEEIWARVRADVVACYEKGKKSVPKMTSARATFHAAIDASGKTTCVVPGEDVGLTHEVEDCIRERLGRESYPPRPSDWSVALPVAVQAGAVSLGKVSAQPTIDMIDSRNLSEDIYDVLDSLLPEAKTCFQTGERRLVYVGARVGKDGAVECAVASSPLSISSEMQRCVVGVFGKARFRAPKRGYGLLSVPIEVVPKTR